ncbi:MAG: SIMPL domain-containing protein, partial [Bacteroidota bacterium]|nr:SIMPL domain-containing protein [Bacteroidota bacterium]
ITYQVKLATTRKMDELVQKLDDEATQNFFISSVSHSKLQAFKKELKIQAVKAAREKAIYLADAINEKAGEAITINEPSEINSFPPPIYANRMMKAEAAYVAGDSQGPNIDFKKIKLKFEVNVTFALK